MMMDKRTSGLKIFIKALITLIIITILGCVIIKFASNFSPSKINEYINNFENSLINGNLPAISTPDKSNEYINNFKNSLINSSCFTFGFIF